MKTELRAVVVARLTMDRFVEAANGRAAAARRSALASIEGLGVFPIAIGARKAVYGNLVLRALVGLHRLQSIFKLKFRIAR